MEHLREDKFHMQYLQKLINMESSASWGVHCFTMHNSCWGSCEIQIMPQWVGGGFALVSMHDNHWEPWENADFAAVGLG